MPQRSADDAEAAVFAVTERVIQDGGTIHEDALWDANEMARDGASQESIADRIRRNLAMLYTPKGRWAS